MGASFLHATQMMLRRRRIILATLLSLSPLFIPLALAFLSDTAFAEDGNRVFVQLVEFIYLKAIAPLLALFFGCMLIGEDVELQTMTYLLTRPFPRSAFVIGRFLSYMLVASMILVLSIIMIFSACTSVGNLAFTAETVRLLVHYLAVAMLALFGYGAFAMFLGSTVKHPIIFGIAFLFGWQKLALYVPGMVDFLTIEKYLLELLPKLATQRANIVIQTALGEFEKQQWHITTPKALASLFFISSCFILGTCLAVRWREYSAARAVTG
jgi:ABC-type transport system involved in multi-copper enzyme maturation permease subunit